MNTVLAIQLYTVRDECARDFRGTLLALADLGYEAVELAGLHGHDPQLVRRWLDEAGLAVTSSHALTEDLEAHQRDQVELARLFGYSRIVMPWTTVRDPDGARDLAARLARAAASLAQAGLSLGYHNHEFELDRWPDGGRMLDLIAAEQSLFLEPDLGWLWFAGEDPEGFLARHGHRCPLIHVKDLPRRGEKRFCPVGAGGVGYRQLLPVVAGLKPDAIIIEQDNSEDQPPLQACAQSIRFVRSVLGSLHTAVRP